jgi:hypothetical protein
MLYAVNKRLRRPIGIGKLLFVVMITIRHVLELELLHLFQDTVTECVLHWNHDGVSGRGDGPMRVTNVYRHIQLDSSMSMVSPWAHRAKLHTAQRYGCARQVNCHCMKRSAYSEFKVQLAAPLAYHSQLQLSCEA